MNEQESLDGVMYHCPYLYDADAREDGIGISWPGSWASQSSGPCLLVTRMDFWEGTAGAGALVPCPCEDAARGNIAQHPCRPQRPHAQAFVIVHALRLRGGNTERGGRREEE